MKKLFLFILSLFAVLSVAAKTTFRIEGPSRVYTHIRIINGTNQENFSCRLVSLNENADGSFTRGEVYGIYNLKKKNDIDTNTKRVEFGTLMGIEMPTNFPEDIEVSVEYSTFANTIRVTLISKDNRFESF